MSAAEQPPPQPEQPEDQPRLLDVPSSGGAEPDPTRGADREFDGDTVAAHLAKGDRRPPDTIWRKNPREQGLIGLTDAIAWFGSHGWDVCLPLIDSQPYDLVIDDGTRLQRVQVKTTTARSPYGVYVVMLATNGGNQSFHTTKPFDAAASDLLYVLTDSRERYLIPTADIRSGTKLNLGSRMAGYRLTEYGG